MSILKRMFNRPPSPKDLIRAVEHNDSGDLAKLLKNNVSFDGRSEKGDTALTLAIRYGYTDLAFQLIEAGYPVNERGADDTTALILAAQYGHADILDALIENGADCEMRDSFGHSPLQAAAGNGHVEAVRSLIAAKVDVSAADPYSETALHMAAQGGSIALYLEGHPEIVRMLIKAGAALDAKDQQGNTPLLLSVKGANEEIIQALADAGASLHEPNIFGETPVSKAIENARFDETPALGAGVEVETLQATQVRIGNMLYNKMIEKNAPMLAAVRNGQTQAILKMIAADADLHATDETGASLSDVAREAGHATTAEALERALFLHAAYNGETGVMVQLLSKNLGLINTVNTGGESALDLAVKGGQAQAAQVLKDILLMISAQNGQTAAAEQLIAMGANLHAADANGTGIVEMARQAGHEETAQALEENLLVHAVLSGELELLQNLLVEKKRDPSAKNSDGVPLLHLAAFSGQNGSLVMLIQAGADLSAKDPGGRSVLDIAKAQGNAEAAQLLQMVMGTPEQATAPSTKTNSPPKIG